MEAGRVLPGAPPTGLVFDVQHYAVHDGPGIRTLVFLKGCPLRCSWCCNPESRSRRPQVRHLVARCRSCLRCMAACPHSAVLTLRQGPRFEHGLCSRCVSWACLPACPEGALLRVGEETGVDGVTARVLADRAFYRNSGGGVTFSGGEPFLQGEFLLALLARCRDEGLHTAVETCGQASPALLEQAVPLVDLFLFDVKLADGDRHRRLTGQDNSTILSNLSALARLCPDKVLVRFPLVPGMTDDPDNVEAIATLVADLRLGAVEICPYHPLGRPKFAEVGLPEPEDVRLPERDDVERVAAVFASRGLSVSLA